MQTLEIIVDVLLTYSKLLGSAFEGMERRELRAEIPCYEQCLQQRKIRPKAINQKREEKRQVQKTKRQRLEEDGGQQRQAA